MSPYHLWIHFLRETTPDACTKQVQEDFAGCWEPDLNISHWIWKADYERGLFYDSALNVPTAAAPEALDTIDPTRQFTVVFDSYATDEALAEAVAAFAKLHREENDWVRPVGRPKWEGDEGLYKLAHRPDVEALTTALEAYRLINANPGVPQCGRRQLSWPPGDNYLGRFEAGMF